MLKFKDNLKSQSNTLLGVIAHDVKGTCISFGKTEL